MTCTGQCHTEYSPELDRIARAHGLGFEAEVAWQPPLTRIIVHERFCLDAPSSRKPVELEAAKRALEADVFGEGVDWREQVNEIERAEAPAKRRAELRAMLARFEEALDD